MTREEAIRKCGIDYMNYKLLVNEIYDEFESKVCENCRLLDKDTDKSYSTCNMMGINIGEDIEKEFGCNFFERKDK